jgi:hypothetical protein
MSFMKREREVRARNKDMEKFLSIGRWRVPSVGRGRRTGVVQRRSLRFYGLGRIIVLLTILAVGDL